MKNEKIEDLGKGCVLTAEAMGCLRLFVELMESGEIGLLMGAAILETLLDNAEVVDAHVGKEFSCKEISREEMELACRLVDVAIPQGCFILLGIRGDRLRYGSSIAREDAVNVMKKFMIHHRYDENG